MTAFHVIIPIPSRDGDPSEIAVPWKVLTEAGMRVSFATPDGAPGLADPLMLSGEGLDLWGWIPGIKKIKLLGLLLRANADARLAYRQLQRDPNFQMPLPYSALRVAAFDALLLPGGHWSRGMREYLEHSQLQTFVADFFDSGKPAAAICHGTVLAARAISKRTGRSVLYGKKTTGLTWTLEKAAWTTMKFAGRWWNPSYYRTYLEAAGEPEGFRSVQAEVSRALASPSDFKDVQAGETHYRLKSSGLHRDSDKDSRPSFTVRDGNYLSARWPGDVHTFAKTFVTMINESYSQAAQAAR